MNALYHGFGIGIFVRHDTFIAFLRDLESALTRKGLDNPIRTTQNSMVNLTVMNRTKVGA